MQSGENIPHLFLPLMPTLLFKKCLDVTINKYNLCLYKDKNFKDSVTFNGISISYNTTTEFLSRGQVFSFEGRFVFCKCSILLQIQAWQIRYVSNFITITCLVKAEM